MYKTISASVIDAAHPVSVFHSNWLLMSTDGSSPSWDAFDPLEHLETLMWSLVLAQEDPNDPATLVNGVSGPGYQQVYGKCESGTRFGLGLPVFVADQIRNELNQARKECEPVFSVSDWPDGRDAPLRSYRSVYGFRTSPTSVDRFLIVSAPAKTVLRLSSGMQAYSPLV